MARRFRLDDYSDRELVAIMDDLKGEDGWTAPLDIARRTGLGDEGEKSVITRLAWMRRFGIAERTHAKPTRWKLTEAGQEMLHGRALPKSATLAIKALKDSEIVWASHEMARRFQAAPPAHATMTRREWQREFRAKARA